MDDRKKEADKFKNQQLQERQLTHNPVFKLKFGDPESIGIRDAYAEKELEKKLKVNCPHCHKRLHTIAEVNLDKGYVIWAGCDNEHCPENPNHRQYGMAERWDGYTDLKGNMHEESNYK